MKETRSFGRLVALVLALAALAVTAGSAQATGGDEGSGEAKKEESEKARGEAKAKVKVDAEAEAEAKARAKADEKARADAEKAAEAAAKVREKAAAKAAVAARTAARAQAKAAAKAAAEAEKAAEAQARAAAKAAAKSSAGVTTKTEPTASQQTTVTSSTPNQGEASKVLTVNGIACATPVAGGKVEGGLGTTINVSSTVAIAKVTVKSGEGAAVVSSSFAADFKSGTITLSKDVSNYVVWTCGAVAPAVQSTTDTGGKPETTVTTPGAPNQGEASKVLTVIGMVCPSAVAGAKVEGGLGTTINVSSTVAIAKVTVKSGEGAAVVSSSFAADFKSGTITLSKDVSNYVVWTCGVAPASVQTTTETTVTTTATQPTVTAQVAGAQTKAQGEAKGQAKAQGQAAGQPGQAQPSSGVLGATASAPESIEETGASDTLPFTGIPLWAAALLGAGLLLTGLAVRRAANH